MTTLPSIPVGGNYSFRAVVAPFLQADGLPFADVLTAESIEQVFVDHDALFGQDDIFSTPIMLWAFLGQALRDGKGASCAAAVENISTYMNQSARPAPCGDTGDYCRARAKLDLTAVRHLATDTARRLKADAPEAWLWKGRHAKLVAGFTFTMPDTAANQATFPQQTSQAEGVGFPIARACTVQSLATAAVCNMAIGPYAGKYDHLITWTRPARPVWMSPEDYDPIPETLTLREIGFTVTVPGRLTERMTVVTTLIDPHEYSTQDIADLYGCRWNVELDIRDIKQTLGLDHVRCKSPEMVLLEVWVTLLAYTLVRRVIATSAALHDKHPRQLGFTLACQAILSSWMLLATGSCRNPRRQWATALLHIARNEVANRPGRVEPRALKRRRHRYKLMTKPRYELRNELGTM